MKTAVLIVVLVALLASADAIDLRRMMATTKTHAREGSREWLRQQVKAIHQALGMTAADVQNMDDAMGPQCQVPEIPKEEPAQACKKCPEQNQGCGCQVDAKEQAAREEQAIMEAQRRQELIARECIHRRIEDAQVKMRAIEASADLLRTKFLNMEQQKAATMGKLTLDQASLRALDDAERDSLRETQAKEDDILIKDREKAFLEEEKQKAARKEAFDRQKELDKQAAAEAEKAKKIADEEAQEEGEKQNWEKQKIDAAKAAIEKKQAEAAAKARVRKANEEADKTEKAETLKAEQLAQQELAKEQALAKEKAGEAKKPEQEAAATSFDDADAVKASWLPTGQTGVAGGTPDVKIVDRLSPDEKDETSDSIVEAETDRPDPEEAEKKKEKEGGAVPAEAGQELLIKLGPDGQPVIESVASSESKSESKSESESKSSSGSEESKSESGSASGASGEAEQSSGLLSQAEEHISASA